MQFFIDSTFIKKNTMTLIGWAAGKEPENEVRFRVTSGGKELPFTVTWCVRPDVGYVVFGDPARSNLGYFMEIPEISGKICEITGEEIEDGAVVESKTIAVSRSRVYAKNSLKKLKSYTHDHTKKLRLAADKLTRRTDRNYAAWFQTSRATAPELQAQREESFAYRPLISILVPVYRTPVPYLRDMIASVWHQSYENWELCIVNADPSDENVLEELEKWSSTDERIHVRALQANQGIASNTNEALRDAHGEFIALLDHDDRLEHDALYHYVKRLNEKPDTDLLYCDEDKITENPDRYFYPNFKPDFNPDMLYNNNYICHLLMVRKSLAEAVNGWSDEYNGAQDYDFILKCIEKTDRIEHIQKVLYHWRSCSSSTSKKAAKKSYAAEAGVRAINAYYERNRLPAHAEASPIGGWYISKYHLTKEPLISILIPNKDHTDDLDVLLRSIHEKCTYRNLEIIVIENNSTEEETFRYYEEVQKRFSDVKVIYWKGIFNFSAINNFGFRASHGDLIMLLNNDTEVITPSLFENMAGYLERPEVGMVGVKLLYQDNTIQHAGVLVGGGGLADHMFKGEKDSEPGYMCRAITTQDVSAVTAACIMMRREVYAEVGGLDESFEVAFNDVDLCLKVRAAGYLIVYDAQSKLYHYESKSRGSENTVKKFKRFGGEAEKLSTKWGILTELFDPYYNDNMSYLLYFKPDYSSVTTQIVENGKKYAATADPDVLKKMAEENMTDLRRKQNRKNEKKEEIRRKAKEKG